MNGRAKVIAVTTCFAVAGLVGLSQNGCDRTADETGTLEMLITDKPFPFEFIAEASVTITRVEVRSSEGDDDTEESGENDNADKGEDNANENEDGDEDAGENENDNAVDDDNDNDAGDDGDNENDSDADDDNDNDSEDDDGDDNGNDNAVGDDDNDNGDDDDENDNSEDDGDNEDGDDDGGSPYITVLDAESTFNLLELQNGITAQLLNSTLPAGSYSQVRLIVSSGKVVLTDGREFELNVPSGEQTGIKLHFHFDIEPNQDTTLLLDVDLSKAFKPVPGGHFDDPSQIQMFHFSPSLAVRVTEVAQTGSISGVVQDEQGNPLAGVSVTAYLGTEDITSTSTTADGNFLLAGLEPGDYEVELSLSGLADQTLPAIAVAAGQESAAGEIVLVAEPAGP